MIENPIQERECIKSPTRKCCFHNDTISNGHGVYTPLKDLVFENVIRCCWCGYVVRLQGGIA